MSGGVGGSAPGFIVTGTGPFFGAGGIGPGVEEMNEMFFIWLKFGLFLLSKGTVILSVPLSGTPVAWLIGFGMGFAVDVRPDETPPIGGGLSEGALPPGTCGVPPDKGAGAGVPAIILFGELVAGFPAIEAPDKGPGAGFPAIGELVAGFPAIEPPDKGALTSRGSIAPSGEGISI
jgi:hypothetical protein